MKTLSDERCRAELIRRLGGVRVDSPARWGRMTAHQMVCHVADCYRMMTGEKAVSSASGPLQRTLVKWLALYGAASVAAGHRDEARDRSAGRGNQAG